MAGSRRTSTLVRRRSAVIRRDRQGLTWTELVQRIETDPCFNIHTADGKYWIDPFTGKKASAAKNNRISALHHYFQTYPHWQKYPIKSIQELHFWRWVHFLTDHIRKEQRLRFFRHDGDWLNPFMGTWHGEVRRVEGRITSMTLHEMAKILAMSVEEDAAQMLPFETLRGIIRSTYNDDDAQTQPNRVPSAANLGESDSAPIEEPIPVEAEEAEVADAVHEPEAAGVTEQAEPEQAAEPEQPQTQIFQSPAAPRARGPDTERAQKVQNHLMGGLPSIPGYSFAVAYHAMTSVSGDFYDIRPLDDERVFICIGDISGHGMQAALAMATALKSLRNVTRMHSDPVDIACALNDDIKDDLLADQFLTMWFGILFVSELRMITLSCGHHQALVANAEGEQALRRIPCRGAAIGMSRSERIRATYKTYEIMLHPGDVLVQYTDGLSEAMDDDEEEYGDLRVQGSLLSHLEAPDLKGILDGVIEDVVAWTGPEQSDDYSLIAMRVADDD